MFVVNLWVLKPLFIQASVILKDKYYINATVWIINHFKRPKGDVQKVTVSVFFLYLYIFYIIILNRKYIEIYFSPEYIRKIKKLYSLATSKEAIFQIK